MSFSFRVVASELAGSEDNQWTVNYFVRSSLPNFTEVSAVSNVILQPSTESMTGQDL